MPRRYTRQELYDLVWDQPTRTVAVSLGVSDVALAKTCRKADIPIPPRGYWAGKADKNRPLRPSLPLRFPGGADSFEIGGGGQHQWRPHSDQEILEMPVPPEPVFEEPLEAVAARIEKMVGKVPAVRNFDKAFGDVARLLAHDDERKADKWGFQKPLYDGGTERRRLLLLNSLCLGFHAAGCKTSMSTSKWQQSDAQSRSVCVTVGAQHVYFTLDPPKRESREYRPNPEANAKLRLALGHHYSQEPAAISWEDCAETKLETLLREIVTSIMLEAEKAHRTRAVSHRAWIIERKGNIEKQLAEEKVEQEREAERMRQKRQKEAVESLLQQAADLQKAEAIRNLVSEIRCRAKDAPQADLEGWADWALAQADCIDPTKSLSVLDTRPRGP